MEECERLITLLEQQLGASRPVLVSSELVLISKILRSLYEVSSLRTQGTNSPTSTPSRERAESSVLLKETSSMIGDTLTHAKVGTFTLQWQSLSGPMMFPGQVTLNVIENSQKDPITVITSDALCARRLGTVLTTEANLEHSPIKLRLRPIL